MSLVLCMQISRLPQMGYAFRTELHLVGTGRVEDIVINIFFNNNL